MDVERRRQIVKGKVRTATSHSQNPLTKIGIADPGAFELTDDEVVALIEKFGFDIEKKESGIPAPYIQDPDSMLQNIYQASHWVARKR